MLGMQHGRDGASLCPLFTLLALARPGALGWTNCSGSTAGVCEQEIQGEVLLTALCFQPCPPESQIWGFQALLHRDLWGRWLVPALSSLSPRVLSPELPGPSAQRSVRRVFPCSPLEDPESLVPLLAKSNMVIFS